MLGRAGIRNDHLVDCGSIEEALQPCANIYGSCPISAQSAVRWDESNHPKLGGILTHGFQVGTGVVTASNHQNVTRTTYSARMQNICARSQRRAASRNSREDTHTREENPVHNFRPSSMVDTSMVGRWDISRPSARVFCRTSTESCGPIFPRSAYWDPGGSAHRNLTSKTLAFVRFNLPPKSCR